MSTWAQAQAAWDNLVDAKVRILSSWEPTAEDGQALMTANGMTSLINAMTNIITTPLDTPEITQLERELMIVALELDSDDFSRWIRETNQRHRSSASVFNRLTSGKMRKVLDL